MLLLAGASFNCTREPTDGRFRDRNCSDVMLQHGTARMSNYPAVWGFGCVSALQRRARMLPSPLPAFHSTCRQWSIRMPVGRGRAPGKSSCVTAQSARRRPPSAAGDPRDLNQIQVCKFSRVMWVKSKGLIKPDKRILRRTVCTKILVWAELTDEAGHALGLGHPRRQHVADRRQGDAADALQHQPLQDACVINFIDKVLISPKEKHITFCLPKHETGRI